MPTFEEIKARASRPATVVSLCLDGEALGEIRELEKQLDNAPVPTNLGEPSVAHQIREQIEAVQERCRESMVDFKLRAIRGPDWAPFWATRPIPDKDESSEEFGGRWFTFVCDLVSRSVVDPAMTPEQVAELADELPQDSWNELSDEAWTLNTNKVSVPFSAAVSALTSSSDEKPRRRPSTASPSADSEASPPAKRPRTTTPKAKSPAGRKRNATRSGPTSTEP